jgi:hypothetical protein
LDPLKGFEGESGWRLGKFRSGGCGGCVVVEDGWLCVWWWPLPETNRRDEKREDEDVPLPASESYFLVVVGCVNLSRGTTLKIVDVMPPASHDETTKILNAPVEIKVA